MTARITRLFKFGRWGHTPSILPMTREEQSHWDLLRDRRAAREAAHKARIDRRESRQ